MTRNPTLTGWGFARILSVFPARLNKGKLL